MKNIWIHTLVLIALLLLSLSTSAADLLPLGGGPGAGAPNPVQLAAILFAVPILLAGLKTLWPSVPKVFLPYMCPFLGAGIAMLSQMAGAAIDPALGAILGALGNWLRETYDQSRKALSAAAAVALASVAIVASQPQVSAAEPAGNLPRLSKADLAGSYYQAGEWSIDGFGTARLDRLSNLRDLSRIEYGGGIGANWFPYAAGGLGVEARTADVAHSVFDQVGIKALGRLPWRRFAVNFGIGGQFNFESDSWDVFAEAGPELRLTRALGVFASARGVRPVGGDGAAGEHVVALLGLRYSFH